MASRALSSTARQFKQLNWTLHGTTIDVGWLIQQIERSIDEVPGLKGRVVSAQVIGNPHPTPNRDDPYHGSVVLLDKDEATFKPVKLPPMPGAPVVPPEGVATGKSDSTSLSNQSTSEKGKK
ncbi:hypothetical protein N7522_007562 [Penicillium canescens]|uniref:Uncharacterized protein n=1 Tax=Penicillium canescens TaxID=5083 RepID=A0AAD6I6N5_PENCN|nr:uncharacterized protein N7446_007590 [Penicillium canescens]KAJ6002335.1 hypothetical protein N7522_007562 [Penicillium canescens]KAJ6030944.1 hypothetical protein N7460_010006 [Penicillium canescens]KAJ6042968.1 hypothetical protein N7444_008232 [Penicillium canescens]KAJ6063470.1 hypothetical protein N7446_007590 [Penicillium canescens]